VAYGSRRLHSTLDKGVLTPEQHTLRFSTCL